MFGERAGITDADGITRFAHPVIRTAIYTNIAPARRESGTCGTGFRPDRDGVPPATRVAPRPGSATGRPTVDQGPSANVTQVDRSTPT